MSSPNDRPVSTSQSDHEMATLRVLVEGATRTVWVSGDLDMTSRAAVYDACVDGDHVDVRAELSRVRFMDCAGYGALVAARIEVERAGGSMVLANPSARARRLLTLIDALGRTAPTHRAAPGDGA